MQPTHRLDKIVVSTVVFMAIVWQLQSALVLAGIALDMVIIVWTLLFAVLLYLTASFISLGMTEATSA